MNRSKPVNKKSKKKIKVTTVRDILALDSVNSVLDDIEQHKGEITGMIAICIDRNDDSRLLTSEMTDAQIVYMLEAVKYDILRANSPFEEEG